MKTKKEIIEGLKAYLLVLLIICGLWVSISSIVQRFKCSKMTETEIFMHIPNSFICNWRNC